MSLRLLTLLAVPLALGAGLAAALRSGARAEASPGPAERGEPRLARATFAGGCFWCMEPPFEKLPGVVDVVSGYTGGEQRNPTYEQVSAGLTGHTEAVQVVYDPSRIGYDALLEVFWRNIDPTTADRQFCDKGRQYRTGIFFHDEEQRRLALASKARVESTKRFPEPIVTEISPAGEFYRAEEYHQDYSRKNPVRYRFYRYNCGRDQRLEQLWGKASN